MREQYDVEVRNEGTIWLFRPLTAEALMWIDDNVAHDALWCGSLVVEHRYAPDISQAMIEDGLRLGAEPCHA